ncbi:hypothetical protein Ddye_013593 [Dipteronia dyeriana]|uniref:Aminotransferase class V domain-containing protein n=1 Tax=Dipteronia dyeriana TaxID=168575 RepID=A0AAD9X6Q0_9ROSI|nr:hypothetical protein Ddye_013593 [Dipteronia dyeriana]
MQSPCLKEVSQVCPHPHGCCPTPFFVSSPDPQNKVSTKSKTGSTSAACRSDFAATTTSSIFPDTQFTNHESLPSLQQSFAEFIKAYPQYSDTHRVDQIRAQEYYHLSLSKHTCLDYFGIGLFSYNQLQEQDTSSRHQIVSPSSSPPVSPSSPSQLLDIPFFSVSYKTGNLKTQLLHGGQSKLEFEIKKRIMNFLNISENDYSMVFTANRTSAFKLVAESYPFQSSRKLLTVYDYESEAVETMIHTSEKNGARVMSAEFTWPRLRIHSAKLRNMVISKKKKQKKRGLFVFPLHSRITGVRYPYQWMRIAQENGWHTLIDACALGPKDMNSFGLSLFRPDFLVCSFYKIFGENPSGFGCLFVKKSTVPNLVADINAGMVSLLPATKQSLMEESSFTDTKLDQTSTFKLQDNESAASNSLSGPLSFQGMKSRKLEQGRKSEVQKAEMQLCKALKLGTLADFIEQEDAKTNVDQRTEIECRGLDQVDSLGLTMITRRARCLINWLVHALTKLQHPNTEGIALVKIYGPKIKFDRGPALAFNVFDWKGEKVEPVLIQKLADRKSISLSYGYLQHILFLDKYQKEKDQVIGKKAGEANGITENKRKDKTDMGITVVTASLGFLANFEDTYRLWAFVAQFLDADFAEKARWRYTALNQKTIEV